MFFGFAPDKHVATARGTIYAMRIFVFEPSSLTQFVSSTPVSGTLKRAKHVLSLPRTLNRSVS